MPRYIGPKDVVAMTGFHYETVVKAMREGELEAHKVRGRWLTTVSKVEAWVEREPPICAAPGDSTPQKSKGRRFALVP